VSFGTNKTGGGRSPLQDTLAGYWGSERRESQNDRRKTSVSLAYPRALIAAVASLVGEISSIKKNYADHLSSYNSTVYPSIYAREYVIYSATEQTASLNSSSTWLRLNDTEFGYDTAQSLRTKASKNQLTRLEPQDCINAYATAFQTQRGSVILVSNDTNTPEPTAERTLESVFVPGSGGQCGAHPFQWLCGGTMWDCNFENTCAANWQSINSKDWRPLGPKVLYCLSEDVDQLCRLQFNRQLAFVVIAFNLVKALVLAYIFFGLTEDPLLTIGDAVVSFLTQPDNTTSGSCLMSKEKIKKWTERQPESETVPLPYDPTRRRWSSVISKSRWFVCLVL
jgi:hypothetical protein